MRNGNLLHVGTSSWSCDDWKAAGFYPRVLEPRDYLAHYAGHAPASIELFLRTFAPP